MSLPPITLPESLPAFLSDEHSIEPLPTHSAVPRTAGHSRHRRLFSGNVPRFQNVTLDLTDDQAAVFMEWFENVLLAGQRKFSAEFAEQGPGTRWWASESVQPPVFDAIEGGGQRVSWRLLLTGRGSKTPPPVTSMEAAVVVYLQGAAAPLVGKPLAAAVVVGVLPPDPVNRSGAGRSSGRGRARAEAFSVSLSTGTAAGVSTASGRSAMRGAAAGTSSAAAVGRSTALAAGVASGAGSATATGHALSLGTAAAAGTSSAAAVGRSTALAAGVASGAGSATATGQALSLGTAATAGTSSAAAVGRSAALAIGATAGVGSATATGQALSLGTAAAAGTSAVTGVS